MNIQVNIQNYEMQGNPIYKFLTELCSIYGEVIHPYAPHLIKSNPRITYGYSIEKSIKESNIFYMKDTEKFDGDFYMRCPEESMLICSCEPAFNLVETDIKDDILEREIAKFTAEICNHENSEKAMLRIEISSYEIYAASQILKRKIELEELYYR